MMVTSCHHELRLPWILNFNDTPVGERPTSGSLSPSTSGDWCPATWTNRFETRIHPSSSTSVVPAGPT